MFSTLCNRLNCSNDNDTLNSEDFQVKATDLNEAFGLIDHAVLVNKLETYGARIRRRLAGLTRI